METEKKNPLIEKENKNPFEIQEVPMTERNNGNTAITNFLIDAMRTMEVSTTKCIFLSKEHFDNPTKSNAAVSYAKKSIHKSYPAMEAANWSARAIKDVEGNYIGTRVYRTH